MVEILRDLPFDEYRKRPGINASLLKVVDQFSLAHARHVIDGGDDDEDTAAKQLGTSFHALMLEGRVDYAVIPETYESEKGETKKWNWNANVCKEWGAKQDGKTLLTEAEAKGLEAMVANATDALCGVDLKGDREISIFAEKDGLPVKCRIDLLPADESAPVIDFKSCTSAEPGKFLRQCYDLRYHLQCAWILDVLRWAGIKRRSVWLVGVETKAPFATCVLEFNDMGLSFLRVGRARCRAAFQKLKTAYETNHWPDYGRSDAESHALPWMTQELEQTA